MFLDKISDKKAVKSANMYDNCTLLHNAAADNDLKLSKRLIEEGLDVNCLMKTYAVNSFKNILFSSFFFNLKQINSLKLKMI